MHWVSRIGWPTSRSRLERESNYGQAGNVPLLEAYGADAGPSRTAHCRLLWDRGPQES